MQKMKTYVTGRPQGTSLSETMFAKMEKLANKIIGEPAPKVRLTPLEYEQIFSAGIKVKPSAARKFAILAKYHERANLRMMFDYWLALYPDNKKCLVCRKNLKNVRGLKIHFGKMHTKLPIDK